jgi:hypothetical protein
MKMIKTFAKKIGEALLDIKTSFYQGYYGSEGDSRIRLKNEIEQALLEEEKAKRVSNKKAFELQALVLDENKNLLDPDLSSKRILN